MNGLPKISIITPSYNQDQYLEDTILSVLGQNYENLEYIIMDGGSDDNSVEIIKKYQDQLAFWISEKDSGQAAAINAGFEKSTGEILMWLNSDDMLMPNVLTYIAEKYLKHGDGIYFGNCLHVQARPTGELFSYGSSVRNVYGKTLLGIVDYIIQPSSFWSLKTWNLNKKLKCDLDYGFDWEWFLRAQSNKIPFYPLDKVLSIYRIHATHKSAVGGSKRQTELLSIYTKYNPKYAKLYSLLLEEKAFANKSFQNLIKYVSPILSNDYLDSQVLKKIKFKKYREFQAEEMHFVKFMI